MPTSQIIRQIHPHDALPDFRSSGVLLRALVFCNVAALLLSLMRSNGWESLLGEFMAVAAPLQPVLLACLLVLYALNPYLGRMPYRGGAGGVLLLVGAVVLAATYAGGDLYLSRYEHAGFALIRNMAAGIAVTSALLYYFRLRAIALTPSLYQARVQALQARIRPHFLFNCINTVLSLVRSDPRRAETALEDMSDLFRMAMAHDGALVPLRDEIELSRRYLALEQLRLGDRLRFNWRQSDLPDDAMVPPLILQPLLENAVYHGIEPLAEGGEIDVLLERKGGSIQIDMRNPSAKPGYRRSGNKLALVNIRERLDLLFDIEAEYTVEEGPDAYRVRIAMPYVKEEQS
jgi:two-component system, LytTR family, sensor histidine kinase AlgZ